MVANMYEPSLESMSQAKLVDYQLEKLSATLNHIHSSNSQYRDHLQGLSSADINTLEDIRLFPFLTKEDLRKAYPFGLACKPQSDFIRMHMSSGTTGTPIINPYTSNDLQQWGEIMARCLTAAGVGRDDVVQITPSFGLFNGGFGFHYGASTIQSMIIPIGAGRTQLQLQFMRDLGTTTLAAIASYPLRLIEVATEMGFDFQKETQLRVGIFGAEIWSDELRLRIEKAMGIETFDIIGMTESGGVGMGIDCKEHAGIHVWEDHYLIEIVDPNSGSPVTDGEWGEMVVTTLTREGLPLIRFRTRDITRVLSRDPCKCGRSSLRVDRIACRTDDMLKVKGINFYPKQVETILLEHELVANDYQIHLKRIAGKDHMRVIVETNGPTSTSLADSIDARLFDLLGIHADIDLVPVQTIERIPGKAIRIVDHRSK